MERCPNCVKATPERLQVIIALGCVEGGTATAEKIEEMLDMPMEKVLDALDGLERSNTVEDVDAEEFYLSEEGMELFNAIYEATGKVVR